MFGRLLHDLGPVPTNAPLAGPGDPRVIVAASAGMALGSVIWGRHLRGPLGLGRDDAIEPALAELARFLIDDARPVA